MKKYLALFLALALLAAVPAMADKSPLLPYEGDEVVYQGFWDEYSQGFHDCVTTDTPLDAALKEKVGNVRIEWEPIFSDARQKLDLMMATGDLPDVIVTVTMFSRLKKYDMSYYLDIGRYAEYAPNLMEAYKEGSSYRYLCGPNGEIWWIPQQVICDAVGENWYVNREALDALGVGEPRTWDEAKEAMKVYKEQNPDKYPILRPYWNWGLNDELNVIGFNLGYRGYGVYYDDEAGEWKFGLTSENAHVKETVEELISLYKDGFLPEDALTRNYDQGKDTIANGDFLFLFGYTGDGFGGVADNLSYTLEPIALDYPLPVYYHHGQYNYDGGVINKDVANPELIVSLMDYWQSEEVQYMNAFGVEGETYEIDEKGNYVFLPEYEDGEARRAYGIGLLDEPGIIFSFARWAPTFIPPVPYDQQPRATKAVITVLNWLKDGIVPVNDVSTYGGKYAADISDADNEIVSANMTPINTFIDENLYQFVEGSRSMDEWDAFVEEAQGYGDIQAVLDIYNNSPVLAYSSDLQWMVAPDIE